MINKLRRQRKPEDAWNRLIKEYVFNNHTSEETFMAATKALYAPTSQTDSNPASPQPSNQYYTNTSQETNQSNTQSQTSTLLPQRNTSWPPQQYPQSPWGYGSLDIPDTWKDGYTTGYIKPKTTPNKLNKYSVEELKGKLVAYATIKYAGLEQTGILFVRKCGAWKLIECSSMTKVASGSQDTPLPDLTIHYIIYTQLEETPKKKGRFDDIEMLETPAE